MNLEDKIMNFMEFVFSLLIIFLIIFLGVATYMFVLDTQANIKVKERIAENGIEISTTQLNDLLGE